MASSIDLKALNDKYHIERSLGEGGWGTVYLATHVGLNVPRALKVLRQDGPGVGSTQYSDTRERFRLEAQLGAQLDELRAEHVVRVYDWEEPGGMLVLVMEYAPGGSLRDMLRAARRQRALLPVEDVLRIAGETATGLAALHELDAVHRDIKPSNILFDAHGGALLADFGLAQVPGGPSGRSVNSVPDPHPGTPQYMSPEQRETCDYLTSASDIYTLGAVMFEMLTGKVYRGVRPGTTVRDLREDVPGWVNALVMRCLAPTPEERPWDGGEFLEALDEGTQAETAQRREAERARREQEAEARRQAEAEEAARKQWEAEEQARKQREAEERARKRKEAEEAARRTLAAERQAPASLKLAPGVEMAFVEVPAGPFLMGSDKKKDKRAYDDEQPQREVILDGYWMGKYPVTNAQYAAFVKAAGHRIPGHWKGGEPPSGKEQHPVVAVSWDDAVAFCAWATEVGGREIRLATEAEWEKAARGTDGRIYPWGDEAPHKQRCNYWINVKDTTAVGQYSPQGDSPYGCADMAGNVREWCGDWYAEDAYTTLPARNPRGPQEGQIRVLRGGSWDDLVRDVRSASRSWFNPDLTGYFYGFRCAAPQSS